MAIYFFFFPYGPMLPVPEGN